MSEPNELVLCESRTGLISGTFRLPRHAAESRPDIRIIGETGTLAPPPPPEPSVPPITRPPTFDGLLPPEETV